MAKDKKEGSACMICMNVILLILGIAVFGCGIYLSVGNEIPPVFASLTVSVLLVEVVSFSFMQL